MASRWAAPVDLSGFSLTGNLSIPGAFRIPPGFVIPGGGFLRVWADSQTGESRPGGDLHVNFKLSAKGDSIGLFAPDGTRIDAVTFGAQLPDISQGRLPDGPLGTLVSMEVPTPGGANTGDRPIAAPHRATPARGST